MCRLLRPARAVLACSPCSALAVRVFLFLVRVSSSPSLAVVDGRCHRFLFLWSRHGCSRTRCYTRCVSSIRARSELRSRQQTCYHVFLLTRLSPAFSVIAPPDSRETTRFTAPLPCCECTQTDVPHTHTCFALGERDELQDRLTHVHTAGSQGRKTDRVIYTSRFVRVVYSSCIVLMLNRLGTVTSTQENRKDTWRFHPVLFGGRAGICGGGVREVFHHQCWMMEILLLPILP